ncbi:MAG: hypothetical protein V1695_02920 [Candidatus Uhrbacteria bacterium]
MRERIVCLFLFLSLVLVGSSTADPAKPLRTISPRCNPDSQFYIDMTELERIVECERDQMQTTGLEQILREREWENHPFSEWAWPIWELDRIYDVRSFLRDNPDPYPFEVVIINGEDLIVPVAAIWEGQDWVFLFPVRESVVYIEDNGPIQAGFWDGEGVVLILPDAEDGWHLRVKYNIFDHKWWHERYPPYFKF